MSLEKKIKETKKVPEIKKFDLFLLKYSKLIDKVDMVLGPVSEFAEYSEADLMQSLVITSSIAKNAIKIPFVAMYLARTKHFSALYDWVPKEMFSYFIKGGSFIDVFRSYEKITYKQYGLKPFTKSSKQAIKNKMNYAQSC